MAQANAGRRNTRSDCYVEIESRRKGGLVIELQSKVLSLYGPRIRDLALQVLQGVGIHNASVRIEDNGALPFVLAARLEAAAARLEPATPGTYHAPAPFAPGRLTGKERPRRSRLYLPGNQPKFFPNAGLHQPDAIILDLEDSVHPAEKDAARLLVRNALRVLGFAGAERMVRINQGRQGLDDIRCIMPASPDVLVIPKCESADQVVEVEREASRISRDQKPSRGYHLLPIVESALGVEHAFNIASSSDRICALAIGLEDYTADIGAERTVSGRESLYARQALVNAAKAAGVQALDSVFSDVADQDALRESCREARSLGFDGKGCIHPRQLRIIHEAFAPGEKELVWAQQVVVAFEEASRQRSNVVAVGSKMIDPPVVKRAQRQVEQGLALGRIPPDWRVSVQSLPAIPPEDVPPQEGE